MSWDPSMLESWIKVGSSVLEFLKVLALSHWESAKRTYGTICYSVVFRTKMNLLRWFFFPFFCYEFNCSCPLEIRGALIWFVESVFFSFRWHINNCRRWLYSRMYTTLWTLILVTMIQIMGQFYMGYNIKRSYIIWIQDSICRWLKYCFA